MLIGPLGGDTQNDPSPPCPLAGLYQTPTYGFLTPQGRGEGTGRFRFPGPCSANRGPPSLQVPHPRLSSRACPWPWAPSPSCSPPLADLRGWLLSDQHRGEPLRQASHAPRGSHRPWSLRGRSPGAVRLCERGGCSRAACPAPAAGQAPQKEAQPQAVPTQPDLQVRGAGWAGTGRGRGGTQAQTAQSLCASTQEAWVQSLVREPRLCMPRA